MDYSNSHVVTSNQYLIVLKQKALDKGVADKFREQKAKEREKISKQVEHALTPRKKIVQRNFEKEDKVRFNNAWFITTVRVVMNDSTLISRQGLGPILWGIKYLA
jgi:hypothetical protein